MRSNENNLYFSVSIASFQAIATDQVKRWGKKKKTNKTNKQKKNRKIKSKANVNTQKIPSFIKQKMLMKILIAWRTVLLNTAL